MRIHQLLSKVLFESALQYDTADGRAEKRGAYLRWRDAGCPLVEEEEHFPFREGNTWMNLHGLVNLDMYPDLRNAIREAAVRQAKLERQETTMAWADQKIKELDGRNTELEKSARIQAESLEMAYARVKELEAKLAAVKPGHATWMDIGCETCARTRKAAFEAAFEEAAEAVMRCHGTTKADIAAHIRGMKR